MTEQGSVVIKVYLKGNSLLFSFLLFLKENFTIAFEAGKGRERERTTPSWTGKRRREIERGCVKAKASCLRRW